MLTDILLASPTRESTPLIIVFSLLPLNSGTLYLNLSFLTCTTCLCLKGRSVFTFGGVKTFMVKNLFLVILFYIFYLFLLPSYSLFLFAFCSPGSKRAFLPVLLLLCTSLLYTIKKGKKCVPH